MRTSESITKISSALLKAQKAITFAAKDATNPHFRSKYADLPSVIDAVKPALNEADIVFVQSPSPCDPGFLALTTRLQHVSGEWMEDMALVPLPKADPQGFGSALTYARRYALAAMTGLYQDDDDGNAAMPPLPKLEPTQPRTIPQPVPRAPLAVLEDADPGREAVEPAIQAAQRIQQQFGGQIMGDPNRSVSEAQVKKARAMIGRYKVPLDAYRKFLAANFGKEHTQSLTNGEISKVYGWIENYKA